MINNHALVFFKIKIRGVIMSELPRAPVARIMKNAGAERVSSDATVYFADVIEEYGATIASRAKDLAHHAGRKTIKASDIKLAME